MDKNNYIFETSWEVCNKNGGIYTVLSTHAGALKAKLGDNLIFIGPDFGNSDNIYFKEDKALMKSWKDAAKKSGLNIKVGRWLLPDSPVAVLVDFRPFLGEKDSFFGEMWEKFGVDSLEGVGDYIDDTIFAMVAGKVIENFAEVNKVDKSSIVAHFHEWQTAGGLLYLKSRQPEIKTVFTTHATTTGRSICFNGKNLYQYFEGYNGDQMARELSVLSKHSIEKAAAKNADLFTTVSDLTAKECKQLLDVEAFVTPNGFDASFVPSGAAYTKAKKTAKDNLKKVAEALLGYSLSDNALMVATSGRFEWRNKGIDVFMNSLNRLAYNEGLDREVVAFIMVPSWVAGPREDLQKKLNKKCKCELENRNITHWVNAPENNEICQALGYYNMNNDQQSKVKVIYVPCLLDGKDGIFNMTYYDLLAGLDMTVFASYYEPWGYTPLESAAFSVPSVTTDLAGFGLWVLDNTKGEANIDNGVAVIRRNDGNFDEVADSIVASIIRLSKMSDAEVKSAQKNALDFAKKASWDKFVKYYEKAYDKVLKVKPAKAETKKAEPKKAEAKPKAEKKPAAKKPAAKK